MRQIVLDTETTGLEPEQGHRIIEIGCVELAGRRLTGNRFHQYLQPDRTIDEAAVEVHGITNAFLSDKPRFGDIAADLSAFLRGAEVIIHNAAFDVGFLNHELARWQDTSPRVEDLCSVTDTLAMAKRLHPGQRNSLDALCKRYGIDNSSRELHGALLDAEILADVYLAMTGGQVSLSLDHAGEFPSSSGAHEIRHLPAYRPPLSIVRASPAELSAHRERLAAIDRVSEKGCLWLRIEGGFTEQG
jgi:DNA polymerase-3 subunit epsilon